MAYIKGEWWVLCDQCQRSMLASKAAKRWDGAIVHADPNEGCWETRHPQEFVRPVRDQFPLPFTRPDNEGLEPTLTVNDCAWLTFMYTDNVKVNDATANVTIYKEYMTGPVVVPDGITVTVQCEWIID
jgi:hypothetical protein